MPKADLSEIRQLSLFKDMSDQNFETMTRTAYLQVFPPHVELLSEGESSDFLYLVVEGCVELFATANSHESSMGMIRQHRTFILAAVVRNSVNLMAARTTKRSKILMIPAQDFRDAVTNDHHFAASVVDELAGCYGRIVKEHKDHKLRTTVERLANRLLRYHNDQGNDGHLNLPTDKRTLASILGMTPENLSRAFNTLKSYGVIVEGSKIQLNDIDALIILAKPNPLIDDRTF